MRFELTTPTLARLCSTTELRPLGRRGISPPEEGRLKAERMRLGKLRLSLFSKPDPKTFKSALVHMVVGRGAEVFGDLALEVEALPGFPHGFGIARAEPLVEGLALTDPGFVLFAKRGV